MAIHEGAWDGGAITGKIQAALEMQSHHDHYVRLHREGKLSQGDRAQYELAMQRQRKGLVKP